MNRLALAKRGLLPNKYYPRGGYSLHPVNNWTKVRSMVRGREKGGRIPPMVGAWEQGGDPLYEAIDHPTGHTDHWTGVHRSAANEFIRRRGRTKNVIQEINPRHLKRQVQEAMENWSPWDFDERVGALYHTYPKGWRKILIRRKHRHKYKDD